MSTRRAAVLVGLAVALWCVPGVWLRATTNARTTADEPQYLMTAASLAADRDLDVANQRAAGLYRAFHEIGLPLQEEIQADGSRVSPHDPFLPAVLAGPMALGGWVAAKLTLAALGGLLAGLLLWVAEVRVGVRRAVAVPLVLAAGLSAPLSIYSTQVYPEILAALLVTAAIAVLTTPAATARRATPAVGFVVILTALAWSSVKYAPVVVALGIVGLLRLRRDLVIGLGVVSAVAFAVLHVRWYGGLTPYAAGRHFTDGQLSVMGEPDLIGRSTRLVGLLVDRDFGIAVWQPLYLVAVPAFAVLVRDDRRLATTLGLPAIAGWLNATFVALTMQGWWFPGRQVVIVLPCLVLAIGWWCEARASRAVVTTLWVGAALGASLVAALAIQVALSDTRLITTFAELAHPWWRAVRVVLPSGRADRPIDAALFALWAVALIAVIVRSIVPTIGRRAIALSATQGA